MNRWLALVGGVVLLLSAGIAVAQANAPPVVSNVTASQIPGTYQVEIRYLLADPESAVCTVWLEVSDNDGTTWSIPATQVSGDVGAGVRPSAGKRIVWNAGADLPNRFGFFRFRVTADDGNAPPGMMLIPAGEFLMGDPFNEGDPVELPRHTVYVSAFYMDRYEVTNQKYADALNWAWSQGNLISVTKGVVHEFSNNERDEYCDTAAGASPNNITWDGSTFGVVAGRENHPMILMSWYGAAAYANWLSGMDGFLPSYNEMTWECNFEAKGYRLPTEAEWEKAARGGTNGHRFPWSDTETIQHSRANYDSDPSYSYDVSPTEGLHPKFSVGKYPFTSPVGYFAPNGYGLHDMAGNLSEWVNDWDGDNYYSISAYHNPRGPSSSCCRIIRDGAFIDHAYYSRSAFRGEASAFTRSFNIGLRLVLNAE